MRLARHFFCLEGRRPDLYPPSQAAWVQFAPARQPARLFICVHTGDGDNKMCVRFRACRRFGRGRSPARYGRKLASGRKAGASSRTPHAGL
jgi:hypothetical protein